MKVFVSSTSTDLAAHRAAAIQSLRRLGHQVIAMEDFTAATAYPLDQVLDLVRSADGFVLIVAWRYGYIPGVGPSKPPAGTLSNAELSITEWEYWAARERSERAILPFVLAETAPWPPPDMDGFDVKRPGDPGSTERVREFRTRLMSEHVVSFFSSVEELESLVGVGVAAARLTRQVAINRIGPGNPLQGDATTPDSSYAQGILDVVRDRATERVITIDIANNWWSTRLYLLAFLLKRFTDAQRILVVAGGSFVGLVPLDPVISVIAAQHPELAAFEEAVRRRDPQPDVMREAEALVELFAKKFGTRGADPAEKERAVMYDVTGANLTRWFPDALLTNPLRLARVDPASPLDLVRIFDYPGDFVPVIVEGGVAEGRVDEDMAKTEQQRCHVIDKSALSVQLARDYVTDLLDELQLM